MELSLPPDIVVLDAGALLEEGQAAFPRLLTRLGYEQNDREKMEMVTVREVLAEILDEKSRASLLSPASAVGLLSSLRVLEPDTDALTVATQFARATGDFHFLSNADLKVIALTVTLKVQVSGWGSVRKQPAPLVIASESSANSVEMPGWGKVSNPEDWAVLDELNDECDRRNKNRHEIYESHFEGKNRNDSSKMDLSPDTNLKNEEDNDEDRDDDGWFKPVGRSTRKRRARRAKRDMLMQESERLATLRSEREKKQTDKSITVDDEIEDKADCSDECDHLPIEQDSVCSAAQNISSAAGKQPDDGAHFADAKEQKQELMETSRMDSVQCSPKTQHPNSMVKSWVSVLRNVPPKDTVSNFSGGQFGKLLGAAQRPSAAPQLDSNASFVDTSDLAGSTEANDRTEESKNQSERHVFCVTGDFAVQNVLIQMGISTVSPTGKRIDSVRRFVFICFACNFVMLQEKKIPVLDLIQARTKFCDRCGKDTLQRATLEADESEMRIFGKKKKFNLRGSRYSIPAPKGGRADKYKQPVLSADEWLIRQRALRSADRSTGRVGNQVFQLDECNSDNWHQKVNTATRNGSLEPSQRSSVTNPMGQLRRNPNERWCHRKRK